VCVLVPHAAAGIAAASALGVIVGCGALARSARPRVRRVLLAFVVAMVATGSVAASVAVAAPGRSEVAAWPVAGGRALSADVVLTGKVDPTASGGARSDAVLQRLRAGAQERSTAVPVVLLFEEPPDGIDMGSSAKVTATAFVADPGDRAVLVLRVSRVDAASAPSGVLAAVAWLRARIVAASEALPQPGAGLVPGLAVGDTRAVAPDLDAAMKVASLTHLTAVSGANCALVVGAGFGIAALLGLRRSVRVATGAALLAGFVLLVTPEPSVVRAAVMAAVAMVALLLGRSGAGVNVLSLSVAVLLIVDPWLAFEIGFALSVAATAALLTLARPLARGLSRGMPEPLALALAVPLSAQLACGPLIVLISPQLSTYGVVANLVAAPAAPVATVLGVLACAAAVVPPLQTALMWLAWIPAAWIAGTAMVVAELPAAQLPWWEGTPGLVAMAAAGAAVVIAVVLRPRGRWSRVTLVASRGGVVLLAGCAVGGLAVATVVAPATVPGRWSIAACDVGQGDAVAIRSAGRIMLVDTGPDPDAVDTCLRRLGVDRVDVLVLTHFDLDHVGGVEALTGRVDTLVHGPVPPGDGRTLAGVAAAHILEGSAGMSGTLGDATWRVLWPRRSAAFPPGNDSSVVVEIGGGGVPRTVLLGDLGAEAQQALRASGALRGPYDVVKVAHHGSADQDATLYRDIAASVGLVSVGVGNDYGHPRAEALAMLAAAGTAIARTDDNGMVLVDAVDGALTWWRERSPPVAEGVVAQLPAARVTGDP
jgi:competence protein ComEC